MPQVSSLHFTVNRFRLLLIQWSTLLTTAQPVLIAVGIAAGWVREKSEETLEIVHSGTKDISVHFLSFHATPSLVKWLISTTLNPVTWKHEMFDNESFGRSVYI